MYPRNILKPVIPSLKPTTAGLWKEDELGVTVYKATTSESSLDVTAGNFYWVDKSGVHHIWASGIEILETSVLPVTTPGVGDPLVAINTATGILYTYNPIDEEWQPISDQAPTNENIYNIDGSLTGDRTLDGLDSHSLTFDNIANFNVNAAGSNFYIDDLSNVSFANLSITTAGFGLLASNMLGTVTNTITHNYDLFNLILTDSIETGEINIDNTALIISHTNGILIKTPNVLDSISTTGQVLTLINASTGKVEYQSLPADTSIYINDGTLTANRTLTGAGFDLTFTGIQDFLYESNSNGNVTFNLNNGISGLGVFLVNVENSTNASDHVIKLVADTANNYGILLSAAAGKIEINSSTLEITNGQTNFIANTLSLDSSSQLNILTPNVNAATATNNQVLTLIDATTGEAEWVTAGADTNFATSNLTATADRTHDFNNFDLIINDTSEFYIVVNNGVNSPTSHLLRGFTNGGTEHSWFMRVGDNTDRATFQLIYDSAYTTSQIELSGRGNTSIHLDSDAYVRIGTAGTPTGTSTALRFYEDDNTSYIAIKAPNSLSADVTFILPSADGTINQALTTNGSGQLAFQTITSNVTHTGEVTGATALTVGATAISNRTEVDPAPDDMMLIGDTSDSNNLKKADVRSVLDLGGSHFIKEAQAFGSVVKVVPIGFDLGGITTTGALADGTARFLAFYVHEPTTLTGVKWFQTTQGNYTADNYNGVGLYSYNAGTGALTLVASSTDDGNIWKAAAATWSSKAFSATYDAAIGPYVLEILYNSSVQTTAPSIGVSASLQGNNVGNFDFTNSAKLNGQRTTQTTLPASQNMSDLTAIATRPGFFLY